MISLSKLTVPNKKASQKREFFSVSLLPQGRDTLCLPKGDYKAGCKATEWILILKGFNSQRSELLRPLPAQAHSPACPWGWFTVTLAVPSLFSKGR